jgi:hypothetical protein
MDYGNRIAFGRGRQSGTVGVRAGSRELLAGMKRAAAKSASVNVAA